MKLFFRRYRPLTSWFMVGIGWLALSCPALAALGGDVTSVEADQAHMKASLAVKKSEGYEVHALRTPSGTVVSEYVSAGRVFAVAWHGRFFPEMQQILGSYFQQYSAALQAQKRVYGHHPLNLEQPGLVVQSAGHMRAYVGRAYIPEMLPASVKVEEIQ